MKKVLYLKNKNITVYNCFMISLALPTSITLKLEADSTVSIGGLNQTDITFGTNLISTGGKSVAGVAGFNAFTAKSNTANTVKKETSTFVWNVTKIENKTTGIGEALETNPITFYTVLDVPKYVWEPEDKTIPDPADPTKTIPKDDKTQPWVTDLEFTIITAGADGQATPESALTQLTTYLHTSYGMIYDTTNGASHYTNETEIRFDLSNYMTKALGNVVNCYDQASVVTVLGRLLGIGIDLTTVVPFGYINTVNLVGVGNCNNPFFGTDTTRTIVSVNDPFRTDFGMHAFAVYNDGVYDACAGPVTGVSRRTYFKNTIDLDKTIQGLNTRLQIAYENYYTLPGATAPHKLWINATQEEKEDFYLDVILSMQIRIVTII
jgi:hypothetical protein